MRRLVPIMTGLAIVLATGAQAQQSVSPPAEDTVSGAPEAAPPAPPAPATSAPAPAPSGPPVASAAPPAAGQPGVVQQWSPPQEVAQAAPQPDGDYPRCTKSVKDSCTNPGGV